MPSIAEILLEQGRQRANARRQEGQISAGMWSNLADVAARTGGQISEELRMAPIRKQEEEARGLQLQGLKDEAAGREASARESAALRQLFSGETQPSEQDIYAVVGPERGVKIIEGLAALQDTELKRFKTQKEVLAATLAGMDAIPEEARAEFYPAVRQNLLARGIITEQDAPEGYDPQWWQQARSFGQEPKKVGTREIKVRNPDGSESIQIVEDKPGFTATSSPQPEEEVAVTVRGPNGRPVRKLVKRSELRQGVEEYREPKESSPTFQRIETVDDAGNPIIQFLTPEEVRAQGGIRTSPKTTAKASGPATVEAILSEIDGLSQKINTSAGGPGSNISGLLRRGAASANLDNDVSEYRALVEGFIPMVARAVGHTGVLTQQDVDSVRALFPLPTDNAQLARNKMERVRRIMTAISSAPGAPGRSGGAGPGTTPGMPSYQDYLKSKGGGR